MNQQPYTIEVLQGYTLIRFNPEIHVSLPNVFLALKDELKLNPADTYIDLWDFRGCYYSRSFDHNAIMQIVDFLKEVIKDPAQHSKSAILVNADLGYGIMRIFQTLASELPYQVALFRQEEHARDWLFYDEESL